MLQGQSFVPATELFRKKWACSALCSNNSNNNNNNNNNFVIIFLFLFIFQ